MRETSPHPQVESRGRAERWLPALVLLLAGRLLAADPPHLRFTPLTSRDGLSQGSISGIIQDRRGFIWLGTQDGLNRYDGYGFTVLRPRLNDPAGLSCGSISCLCEDDDGDLWIGTSGGGLFRRSGLDGKTVPVSLEDRASRWAGSTIMAMLCDRSGTLWISHLGAGPRLLRLNAGDRRRNRYRFQPVSLAAEPVWVTVLFQDPDGPIWAGSPSGLHRLDPRTGQSVCYANRSDDPDSLSAGRIAAICRDSRGSLWIGTTAGLDRLDPDSRRFIHFRHRPDDPGSLGDDGVSALLEDSEGQLWIGTARAGLHLYDRRNDRFIRYSSSVGDAQGLISNSVSALVQDRSGMIWVGTFNYGVCQFDPRGLDFQAFPVEPSDAGQNLVFAVGGDPAGTVWAGTSRGQLVRLVPPYDRLSIQPTRLARTGQPLPDVIRTILTTGTGETILGTGNNGLLQLDPADGSLRPYGPPGGPLAVLSMRLGRNGDLWVGTRTEGLFRLPHRGSRWERHSADSAKSEVLHGAAFYAVLESLDGTVWIGTWTAGLNRLDPASGRVSHYTSDPDDPGSLSSDHVLALHEDREGDLWAGTATGLNRFSRRTGRFTRITTANGLDNDYICSINEDSDGFLWLGTNGGLARLDPRDGSVRNFHEHHGLANEEFAVGASLACPQTGAMVVGGINGLTVFRPGQIRSESRMPELALTAVTVHSRRGGGGFAGAPPASLRLDYRESFSVAFAVMDFVSPRHNRFAYRILGKDAPWLPIGERHELTFSGLEPGRYRLQIRGANSLGIWSERQLNLGIDIVPPFWLSGWFRALLALAGLGAVLAGFRVRLRHLARKLNSQAAVDKFLGHRLVSKREREILGLLLEGKGKNDIERELFIAPSTVQSHISSIYRKLGVKNRYQLLSLFRDARLEANGSGSPPPRTAPRSPG